MRKTPTYDWDWFENHAPFRKILEKYSKLEIDKEFIPYQVIGYIWAKRVHYNIKINYGLFQENFDTIKANILNTRVCKHNGEVRDWVLGLTTRRKDVYNLVIDGCLVYDSASFTWDWCDD